MTKPVRRRLMGTLLGGLILAAVGGLYLGVQELIGQPRLRSPEGRQAASRAGHADSFADLVEALKPSVVNITATGSQRRTRVGRPREVPHVEASGVIIDPSGYVVTNEHVIEGARAVRVRLWDDEEYDARIVGRDPWTDLALLKIEAPRPLPAAVLGDSDRVRAGDWVLAVGSPFGLERSVTAGIVSAKGRVIGEGPDEDFLQTDAAINPGNSGGPLFDLRGEVVGINSIGLGETGSSVGVNLAISINLVREIVPLLKAHGRVARGALGIGVLPMSSELATRLGRPNRHGAVVATVAPKGPAARSGLRAGDLVVAYQDQPIRRANDLARLASRSPAGSRTRLTVIRGSATLEVAVTVAELRGRPTHGEHGIPLGARALERRGVHRVPMSGG